MKKQFHTPLLRLAMLNMSVIATSGNSVGQGDPSQGGRPGSAQAPIRVAGIQPDHMSN